MFEKLMHAGFVGLIEYLSAHVLTCLIPAFFIAGAISVFVSQASVMRYFGPKTNKIKSYGVASVSGTILAVCSCTVLPLFAGIYTMGAGLGPAIAFLYSGPAINILAIVYSARLLGFDIGLARVIGAVSFSIIIGLLMAFIFRNEKKKEAPAVIMPEDSAGKSGWVTIAYFASLVCILIFGAGKNWILAAISLIALFFILYKWFNKEEIKQWFSATWSFVKMVTPWLLAGVFIAGMLKVLIPQEIVGRFVGGNSFLANFIASVFGAFMYFATLTEVPIIKAFMQMGMGKGPVLALLLAGPALSLPSMLALGKIMGAKKTIVYVCLVVVMSTFAGMIFGLVR